MQFAQAPGLWWSLGFACWGDGQHAGKAKACSEDPVRGPWCVDSGDSVTVSISASSLGIGLVLDVGGNMVEDASWLHKETDHSDINVAELEAVARSINLSVA